MSKCKYIQHDLSEMELEVSKMEVLEEDSRHKWRGDETILLHVVRPGVASDEGCTWVGTADEFKTKFKSFDTEAKAKKDKLLKDHKDKYGTN